MEAEIESAVWSPYLVGLSMAYARLADSATESRNYLTNKFAQFDAHILEAAESLSYPSTPAHRDTHRSAAFESCPNLPTVDSSRPAAQPTEATAIRPARTSVAQVFFIVSLLVHGAKLQRPMTFGITDERFKSTPPAGEELPD